MGYECADCIIGVGQPTSNKYTYVIGPGPAADDALQPFLAERASRR